MRLVFIIVLTFAFFNLNAQSSIKGSLKDDKGEPVAFANVALYNSIDSNMVKVETTDDNGSFHLKNISVGNYFLKATFVGLPDLVQANLELKENEQKKLEVLTFESQAEELAAFNVTEERVLVEIKPDRTIFNVEGTINSTGEDAISLLRKAPAVTVDNQDNINVLGRSGVKVYIDGKKLPLSGDDLSNYLKNIPADQIDRMEIITNPGAKYEAEGNAGIIDIRLKKDKNMGANGTLSGTYTQGELTRYNVNGTGNYRNKRLNVFGALGYNVNDNFHNIYSKDFQNGLILEGVNNTQNNRNIYNFRLGTDFFLHKNHTIGFLVGGRNIDREEINFNKTRVSNQLSPIIIDSVLIADNNAIKTGLENTYNLNYRFYNKAGQSINIDLDYGQYQYTDKRSQPNIYYNATEDSILTEVIDQFDTPINIDIYTAKLDYERNVGKGKLGIGTKYSLVETKNTFTVFNVVNDIATIDNLRSNLFDYNENVYAGYLSFSHALGKKWNVITGLRAEQTESVGDLTAFLPSLQEPAVKSSYLSWFPSAGLTWSITKKQSLALNYGRRINRPNYNVLNPFRTQRSELSFESGNPFLKPEIVNNYELGYTLNYKYNFKVAYSKTEDKITRLIGPDPVDPRAGFISWDNLATETVTSFNASLPFKVAKWWDAFLNLSASYTDNQADYGNGAVVDVQNFNYVAFQQHTFKLFKGIKGEVSGYYTGPGVWGGVFKYEANWSIGAGVQREFLKKKLKARLNVSNITNRDMWKGFSEFNGLRSEGNGRMDMRFISVSLSYNFGNQNVKSRKRKTGIEAEGKRVGD
jgi:iron complex outermembrane recepter protein